MVILVRLDNKDPIIKYCATIIQLTKSASCILLGWLIKPTINLNLLHFCTQAYNKKGSQKKIRFVIRNLQFSSKRLEHYILCFWIN